MGVETGKQALLEANKRLQAFNMDGRYINAITKYNTQKDSDTAFSFVPEPLVPDSFLSVYYEQNGLFSKIIDTPAEEAIKEGIDLSGLSDSKLVEFIEDKLDDLSWDEKFEQAVKWSRLFGGAIIVMLIDDGGTLEKPLNKRKIKSIDDMVVYERAVVTPDYSYMSCNNGNIYEPEFYIINSVYGRFRVHKSRCLIFKNGVMPELASNEQYRYWGIPEYVRIKHEIRRTVITHDDAGKLLGRSVQAIHKMKGLNSLLSSEDGEKIMLKRLNAVDMARNMLNTIAIDSEGEEYDFKTFTMTGVKDIVEVSCNLLSAITNIPQTILFGRSPAGMNSTGESDLENYYNFIQKIQKSIMKSNVRILINVLFQEAIYKGITNDEPKYKVKFMPLWSLSEKEKAEVENTKAQAAKTRAEAAIAYIDAQVLDPSEVRNALADIGEFEIEKILDNAEVEKALDQEIDEELEKQTSAKELLLRGNKKTAGEAEEQTQAKEILLNRTQEEKTGKDILLRNDNEADVSQAAAVIVVKDGYFLVGDRKDTFEMCGPGGHIEYGETPIQAAIREAREEFNIIPTSLKPLFKLDDLGEKYAYPVNIYLCTEFEGFPATDEVEMTNCRWLDAEQILSNETVFEPFRKSIVRLLTILSN